MSKYRRLFAEALPADLMDEIRRYLAVERALGSARFRAWVESRTGQFSAVRVAATRIQLSPYNCL